MASKFTPEQKKAVQDKIISYILKGGTYRNAAQAAGITYQTLLNWRELDPDFNQQVEEAKASVTIDVTGALLESCKQLNSSSIQYYLNHQGGQEWRDNVNQHELEALLQILHHLVEQNGLLPPDPAKQELSALTVTDTGIEQK